MAPEGESLSAAVAETLMPRIGDGGDVRQIKLTGSTCIEGRSDDLADKRAHVVRDRLVDLGITSELFVVQSVHCEDIITYDFHEPDNIQMRHVSMQALLVRHQRCPRE